MIRIINHFTKLLILLATLTLPVTVLAAPRDGSAAAPLVAVIPSDFPPTYFRDSNGQPAGLAVEVMDAVAQRAGLSITYRFARPWQEIEQLVLDGEADLIPLRVMNDKTLRDFTFTEPVDIEDVSFIVRSSTLATVRPQPASRVGVIKGSTAWEHLQKKQFLNVVQYESMEHLLVHLLSGQIDAILTVKVNLKKLAKQANLEDRINEISPAEMEVKRGIALRHADKGLLLRLNAALRSFHESGESIAIYQKWHGNQAPYWTAKRTALAMGTLLGISIMGLSSWYGLAMRRTNRRLKAEQQFLQTMIDAIPDFIFFKDRNSVYLGCNRAFAEQVHGQSKETLVGLRDADLHSQPEIADHFRRTDLQVMESGSTMKFEVSVPLKNGNVMRAESIKTSFRNDAGQIIGVIGVSRDITERHQYQQQLEEARKRAEVSNRAKGQFLANMSHEIRTPLNGVLGMAQLLGMSSLTEEQREQLGMIQSSGENLLAILNDILDLAKIEADTLHLAQTVFSPDALLNEIAKLCRFSCDQKGIILELQLPPDLPAQVEGDPLRLKQILFNLLGNAVKFTSQGQVSLKCSVLGHNAEQITLRFDVCDTGIGISAKDQERIFQPFEQVDNSNTRQYGGTGLGLAICRRLTSLMDGELTVASTPGQGSCFSLVLGFKTVSLVETTPAVDPLPKRSSAQHYRVLVAEDNQINRLFMVKLLQQLGHQAVPAEHGQQALELLTLQPYDLILMDIQMPVLDGSKALQEIRRQDVEHRRHTPVIALTAHAMVGDREKFMAQGFDDYLAKPLKTETVRAAIERCMAAPEDNP